MLSARMTVKITVIIFFKLFLLYRVNMRSSRPASHRINERCGGNERGCDFNFELFSDYLAFFFLASATAATVSNTTAAAAEAETAATLPHPL